MQSICAHGNGGKDAFLVSNALSSLMQSIESAQKNEIDVFIDALF